jgi:hypothetical protein
VHPLAAYLGWLHDAGFEPPERHCLVDEAQAMLLVARKPAGGHDEPSQRTAGSAGC